MDRIDIQYDTEVERDCPKCGYPTNGKYFGVYCPGNPCDGCGYLDEQEAVKYKKIESERAVRVKKLKESPPIFKSIKDWEDYKQANKSEYIKKNNRSVG